MTLRIFVPDGMSPARSSLMNERTGVNLALYPVFVFICTSGIELNPIPELRTFTPLIPPLVISNSMSASPPMILAVSPVV